MLFFLLWDKTHARHQRAHALSNGENDRNLRRMISPRRYGFYLYNNADGKRLDGLSKK